MKPNLNFIVADNESAVQSALTSMNYVQVFLLVHSLIESLLRAFLDKLDPDLELRFSELIKGYEARLAEEHYPSPTFVKELTEFNRRRNRIIHCLWRNGFTHTNTNLKDAAEAAVHLYSLFIEWLQTFDDDLENLGFKLSDEA